MSAKMATKGDEGFGPSDFLTGFLTAGVLGKQTNGKHKTGLLAPPIWPLIDEKLPSYCRPSSWTTVHLIFNIPAPGEVVHRPTKEGETGHMLTSRVRLKVYGNEHEFQSLDQRAQNQATEDAYRSSTELAR